MKKRSTLRNLNYWFAWLLVLWAGPALFVQTFSGIGNTWLGGIYTTRRGEESLRHIQGKISEGYVTADGQLFAVAVYDEAHHSLVRYWDNGDGRAATEIVGPGTGLPSILP